MSKTIFSAVKSLHQAEQIVEQLRSAGFANFDISILYGERMQVLEDLSRQQSEPKLFAAKHTATPTRFVGASLVPAPTFASLPRIGAVALAGAGTFIAAGPIMKALSKGNINGNANAIPIALASFGLFPADAAQLVERVKNKQQVLVGVRADSSAEFDQAKQVLSGNSAEHIIATCEVSALSHKCQW